MSLRERDPVYYEDCIQAINSRALAINNTHDYYSKIERCVDFLTELHSRADFILARPNYFRWVVNQLRPWSRYNNRLKPLVYNLSSALHEKIHKLPPILSDHHDIIDKLFSMCASLASETQFPDGSDSLFAQL